MTMRSAGRRGRCRPSHMRTCCLAEKPCTLSVNSQSEIREHDEDTGTAMTTETGCLHKRAGLGAPQFELLSSVLVSEPAPRTRRTAQPEFAAAESDWSVPEQLVFQMKPPTAQGQWTPDRDLKPKRDSACSLDPVFFSDPVLLDRADWTVDNALMSCHLSSAPFMT
ncbi:hypothetical protein CRENBAI_011386 [Crenichthys baileyi]|uniref:Uncharacterized protein n=1 Tax=Crenichthys baileyi TaxID=28760 RepID=A0AAV9R5H6_9TELE